MPIKLREIRQKCGKTQFEIGREVGIQPTKISDIENGRRDMRFQEAIRIARLLNVSLDELAGYGGSKSDR